VGSSGGVRVSAAADPSARDGGFFGSADGFFGPADGPLGADEAGLGPVGRGAPPFAAGRDRTSGSSVASSHTSPGGCAVLSLGRVCRPAADTAASNADIASCITAPTASAAAATPVPSPGPDSRSRRLARQIGHQAHSGASSEVAVSHTSAVLCFPPPPSAVRIWPLSCRVTLRAPERTSQR
jgi:hypothetical protein